MSDRCVHCGRTKEQHPADTLRCYQGNNGPVTVYSTLALPAGRTCGDCIHFKRTCEWLISCKPDRTSCDWWPVRFVAKAEGK